MKVLKVHGIKFIIFGQACENRARTLLLKEPETIAWINTFPHGSVLWDIGANVGCYSLYAASLGHRVIAVEPSPWTFACLCENVKLNKFEDRVTPVCMVASDHTGTMAVGFHDPGKSRIELGTGIQIPVTTITDLAAQYSLPIPSHMKIDTDGHDLRVLRGAGHLVSAMQSVIVETGHHADDSGIDAIMRGAGFKLTGFHKSPMGQGGTVGMSHWHKQEQMAA